jgi:hypothetical protein
MEEKQKRCRRCHGGHLRPTLNLNDCGWTRIEMNLREYFASKGKVENIHNVNYWFLWYVRALVMIWKKLWNMLRIVQALDTVLNAESIYLLILSVVLAAIKDSVLNLRKDFLTLMDSEL